MQAIVANRGLARAGAASGLLGVLLLSIYFATPFLTNCPCGSASPQLADFIRPYVTVLYAGAWLQASGTLLCVVFFVAIVYLARAANQFAGLMTLVGAISLLCLVLVEAAFLTTIAPAVLSGDNATFSTAFLLSTGVFTRIYPLAPASLTYVALGAVLLGSTLLPRWLAIAALALGVAFELAGVLAIFSTVGLVAVGVLAAVQEIWIVIAAVASWRSSRG